MALTASLDKPAGYKTGDTITLTIVSDKRIETDVLDLQAAGEDAKVTTIVQLGFVLSDPRARTWTTVSDDGKTVVLTTKA